MLPLVLAGQTYAKGLGVHALSLLVYPLNGSYQRVKGLFGIPDGFTATKNIRGTVTLDGVRVFDTGSLSYGMAAVPFDLDVSGKSQVMLAVQSTNGQLDHAHAVWADARLTGYDLPPIATPTPA